MAADPAKAARLPQLLVTAQRAVQWKNTQRWIIRRLGTIYATRLRFAFGAALLLGLGLVLIEALSLGEGFAIRGFEPGRHFQQAALSGLGFAAAAGLLGASFSAMTGQSSVVALDNIEEASAATSWAMIALRLGVGVAAAMILYFFFEAQLVDGALFPDLSQIGFGRVLPTPAEADAALAMMDEVARSRQELIAAIDAVKGGAQVAAAGPAQPALAALDDLNATLDAFGAAADALGAEWRTPLGQYVPNADLAKLVVWCFAAGFVQTFVPSLLATVGKTGEAAKAPAP